MTELRNKSKKASAAAERYCRLAAVWPPHPIDSARDYDAAVRAIDPLITRTKLHDGERQYLAAVSAFIESYDREHFAKPATTLPERIEHLLEAEGLSQADLAKVIGKSPSLISDILAGRRSGFTRDQIATLAARFDMDQGYFF
ncbi:MAG: helix-turn-helix domain-containing protein [Planctomycetota bacterium]